MIFDLLRWPRHPHDRVALAVDQPEPCGTTLPSWKGKRAPTGLKTYDAWRADPTRAYLNTPFYEGEEPKWPPPPLWLRACLWISFGVVAALPWLLR